LTGAVWPQAASTAVEATSRETDSWRKVFTGGSSISLSKQFRVAGLAAERLTVG
jgi:hypothetical protein